MRSDGYHELRTIFQTIDLHDDVVLRLRGEGVQVRCDHPGVPRDGTNLAARAAQALLALRRRPARRGDRRSSSASRWRAGWAGAAATPRPCSWVWTGCWGWGWGRPACSLWPAGWGPTSPFFCGGDRPGPGPGGRGLPPVSPGARPCGRRGPPEAPFHGGRVRSARRSFDTPRKQLYDLPLCIEGLGRIGAVRGLDQRSRGGGPGGSARPGRSRSSASREVSGRGGGVTGVAFRERRFVLRAVRRGRKGPPRPGRPGRKAFVPSAAQTLTLDRYRRVLVGVAQVS